MSNPSEDSKNPAPQMQRQPATCPAPRAAHQQPASPRPILDNVWPLATVPCVPLRPSLLCGDTPIDEARAAAMAVTRKRAAAMAARRARTPGTAARRGERRRLGVFTFTV